MIGRKLCFIAQITEKYENRKSNITKTHKFVRNTCIISYLVPLAGFTIGIVEVVHDYGS